MRRWHTNKTYPKDCKSVNSIVTIHKAFRVMMYWVKKIDGRICIMEQNGSRWNKWSDMKDRIALWAYTVKFFDKEYDRVHQMNLEECEQEERELEAQNEDY